MSERRSLFRARALESHLEARTRAVLPRLVAPRIMLYCWMLLMLLGIGLLLLWSARVPVYASGLAVVVQNPAERRITGEDMSMVVFFPADQYDKLKAGQTLFVSYQKFDDFTEQPLLSLDSRVSSPEEIGQRYTLTNVGLVVNEPMVVGVTRFSHTNHHPADLPELNHTRYVGTIAEVQVTVGSRRLISFLPVLGELAGQEGV